MGSVKASHGGKQASTASVLAKQRTMISVPFIELEGIESLVTGFRQESISCEDGSVGTHGGFGSPFAVTMNWKGKHVTISSIDLLAAWVRTFSPEDADAIEKATVG